MTIFYNGNTFKYEMENILKLFYPVRRFRHVYESKEYPADEYVSIDVKPSGEGTSHLSVTVKKGDFFRTLETQNHPDADSEMECARLLYRLLHELTGVRPQWGVLTGIRPVKWVQRRLSAGKTPEEIRREFEDELFVAPEKIDLSFRIAEAQKEILADNSPRDFSLYVSIPYCPSRCSYCSFVSHAITGQKARALVPEYLNKLVREISFTAKISREIGLRLRTVYIGGGTPTALSAGQLKQVTDAVAAHFPLSDGVEYTIEAGRADTIDEEKLAVIREAGATRISINPQTFEDGVLEAIGRKHTGQQVVDCYELARKMGFSSINMDLIAGLPTDTFEGFCRSVDKAVSLNPENITVHTLSLKRSSALFQQMSGDEDYSAVQKMVEYAYHALTLAGYEPYYLYRQKNTRGNLENVGYAKPGHFGKYNVYIMDEIQTILAAGAGAVTKIVLPGDIERIYNYKYPYEYISGFDDILAKKQRIKTLL